MNGKAPVDDVGGRRNQGPWPEDVEEIAVDDRLSRPVEFADGSMGETDVLVTNVRQLIRDSGEETDGYAVTYQFEDPTF